MYKYLLLSLISLAQGLQAQTSKATIETSKTQVVMLGTGTPFNDAKHLGQAVVIIVNKTPYLVDFGPGFMRQFDALQRLGKAPDLGNLRRRGPRIRAAFLTHLDSDHVTGLPELVLVPWTLSRKEPLPLYGPPHTQQMVNDFHKTYQKDIQHRLGGRQPATENGYKVVVNEITKEGLVYQDDNIKVETFFNAHGDWEQGMSLGYRFTTPDKVIVHSGDTTAYPEMTKNYQGADILIHEIYSKDKLVSTRTTEWQTYHGLAHTSPQQLADIAKQVQPKLVVLNHVLFFGSTEDEMAKEFDVLYEGKFVLAQDLDVYE